MSEEEKVIETTEVNTDNAKVASAEDKRIVPPPEETAQIEQKEFVEETQAEPIPEPTPEELSPKDLYGHVQGPVKFWNKATKEWERARWQPPYPTPKSLEPYIVKKDDKIWLIAEKYGVTNAWIRRCNSIDYLDQNKLKPGKVLKFT
ncbi:LysM peptidoglycan-binding domain-containing protein [Ligilactobacillus apodemi]|uniref:LysM domain-containing protein n=1 Tax=Ligilactobacillus apodemi DSM 16634 = JCM 16172 TaxID=1423724 RepID=A0A0R1TTF7_9LACO|nr:LysM domain-containing protein [Ligilactobacillus apodemi]KRL84585.1 hypothetical protein FC32_GL000476 [Ligilactobacillus apodemi DSM 16634 = JCM 16172]